MELLVVLVIVSVVIKGKVRRRAGSGWLVVVQDSIVSLVPGVAVGAVTAALSLHVE